MKLVAAGIGTIIVTVALLSTPSRGQNTEDGGQQCQKDSECEDGLGCLGGQCLDPCLASDCPLAGAICKVVGRRPVCSCPPGTNNKDNACVPKTQCIRSNDTYSEGDQYYDDLCTQRCECHLGSWLCEETRCSPGLIPRGLLDLTNDPQCEEREHPAGDECCVLWVCADDNSISNANDVSGNGGTQEEDERSSRPTSQFSPVCENIICGENAECEPDQGECLCLPGFSGNPNDLVNGCQSLASSSPNIKLLQITSSSIQVQFPDITGGNLMYVESALVSRKDPPWENAIILEGNEIFTLTGLRTGTPYTLRWKTPDQQYPDVQVSTANFDRKKPKVILLDKTHDSVRLSFDPFKSESDPHGYVATWREKGGGKENIREVSLSSVGDTPSITLDGLKPDTQYSIKISVYENYSSRQLGLSTEEIELTTLPGCIDKEVSHAVGKFFRGCEATCSCKANGTVECGPRCEKPFFRRGGFADDPFCVERDVDDAKCCVLVTCAGSVDEEDSPCQEANCGPHAVCKHEVLREEEAETICVCEEGYRGDPDSKEGCNQGPSSSPLMTSPAPACIAHNSNVYSVGEVWNDGCDYKCTCSSKLEIICQPRCNQVTDNLDDECELKPDPEDSCCQIMVCPNQSSTAEDDLTLPSLPFEGCVFKNNTYHQGERFYDGCDQQCECQGFGDLVCLARCPPTNPEIGDNCYTLPDLTDNCCNVTVCDKVEKSVPDVEKVQNGNHSLVASVNSRTGHMEAGETSHENLFTKEKLDMDGDDISEDKNNQTDFDLDVELAKTGGEIWEPSIHDLESAIAATTEAADEEKEDKSGTEHVTEAGLELTKDPTTDSLDKITITEVVKVSTPKTPDNTEEKEASTESHIDMDSSVHFPSTGDRPDLYEDIDEYDVSDRSHSDDYYDEDFSEVLSRGLDSKKDLLGTFNSSEHNIQGTVYAVNSTTFLIEDFTFDGTKDDDAFFYVGHSGQPNTQGTILPYPETSTDEYELSDDSELFLTPLSRLEGRDLYLRVPTGLEVGQLGWLAVQSRITGISFGSLELPQTPAEGRIMNTPIPGGCLYRGVEYRTGDQFHDGCESYCACPEAGIVECFPIKCPSQFGLDVISPDCIEWDYHTDFNPSPPLCCPPVPECKSDGSCIYKNQTLSNYAPVPQELTGCLERCHCENTEVKCQAACYKVSPNPPGWLTCAEDERPELVPNHERACCEVWGCVAADVPEEDDNACSLLPARLSGTEVRALNESAIGVTFHLPEAAAGRAGHLVVNYAGGLAGHPDPDRWPAEVFKLNGGKLDTSESREEVFGPLSPNTPYFIRPAIVITDCGVSSLVIPGDVLSSRTKSVFETGGSDSLPLVVYLDLQLAVSMLESTSARITWRHFEEVEEKPFIDGVQLRFLPLKGNLPLSQVPETSPFIHRDTNYFTLENLTPGTRYEVELDLIPVSESRKELYSGKKLEFQTLPLVDVFDFQIQLQIAHVGGKSVEVTWDGVPSPDQKFVNIYRVIYHTNNNNSIRDESSVFKISKIDSPKRILITNLTPRTSYQIWLEAYLTNGKMKKSNVAEFQTSDRADLSSLPSTGSIDPTEENNSSSDNWYGSMVAAAIIAAFGLAAFLVILYFFMKRNITYKATITKERPRSVSSYDNNGFKETTAGGNGQLVGASQSIEMEGIAASNGVNGKVAVH